MLFLQNKYTSWYYSIISKVQHQNIDGYTEKHHIIPSSLGGSNCKDNIVKLTPRQHFVCHLLLTKMTVGNDKYKMCFAFHMLSNAKNIGDGRYTSSSRLYEYAKKCYVEALNDFWTEEKRKQHAEKIRPIVKGIKRSELAKEKYRNKEWSEKALKTRLDNCLKSAKARKGSKWSSEKREQMFMSYIEKNKHLFPQVFSFYDSGMNIRQISLNLGISWDRVNLILEKRDKISKYNI